MEFGIWKNGFHDCVGIRKDLKAVSQVRVGGYRRGSPRCSYNAGSAGLVDGAGYPTREWGGVVGEQISRGGLEGAARRDKTHYYPTLGTSWNDSGTGKPVLRGVRLKVHSHTRPCL